MKNLFFLFLFFMVFSSAYPAPYRVGSKTTDLVYANNGGRDQRLDIYYPKTPAPPQGYPLIICFHGGAWIIGNKHWDLVLRNLTNYGYAITSVDYRLSREARYPAQLVDARNATHWLLQNASSLHLDPNRIGVSGASAGGHIALLLAFTQNQKLANTSPLPKTAIKAVCALYPVTDLISIVPPQKRNDPGNVISKLLGAPISQRLMLAMQGSPMTYVSKNNPPVMLIHGDKDMIVPISQSENLAHAMWKTGADTQLIIYAGRIHGFGLYPSTLMDVKKFFDRHLRPVK
ncbi:MAG: alpha/beta hydrolase [Chthoniobacterales bacterium]